MNGKLVLLDGYSLMYRAYHGLGTPMTAADGTPTNAIHGFMLMLAKVLSEEKPELLAVAFDTHAKTKRAERYDLYKATRKPMPDDLRVQDPIIRELLERMHIPMLQLEGYEGDDILGTVSAACERDGREVLLVTGDRDSFQLAGEHTTILYTKKGIQDTVRVTPDWVLTTYGLGPAQLIDVKALMGDTSDNIPGIAGIGEKTALKLIAAYGSLEEVLAHASEQKGKLRERLETGVESARLSRELAEIDRSVPIELDWEAMRVGGIADAAPRLKQLSLNMALKRLTDACAGLRRNEEAEPEVGQPVLPPIDTEEVATPEALAARCEALASTASRVAVYVAADAVWVACDEVGLRLPLGGGDLLSGTVDEEKAVPALLPLMRADCPKAVWNLKQLPFAREDIRGEVTDVMLTAYVLDPGRSAFDAASLTEQEGIEGFDAQPALCLQLVAEKHRQRLAATDMERVYTELELPLAYVLRDMERSGMRVDDTVLREMGVRLRAHIAELTETLYAMMGARINLNSPKQLAEQLYDVMGIPAPKKRTTNAAALEELADEHPVCATLLEYRKYTKLESTYIRSLIDLRDAEGRIHSRFDQVATATGRISSAEPNLQNIPVRTELGREIRSAFVAGEGCVLLDADYSQIELRVLASISGDETMCDAFRRGQDIHARTASEVYGVPLEQVTPQMRTSTKAVNFGIVYGISDFTLAKNIGVSRREAKEFIERYFRRYPGVKRYMDEAVQAGYRDGYVSTLMGRRRYLPELKSTNFNMRAFGERCAMNSPIQGTAADIIKLAMIRTADALREQGLRARLILQVHDELLLECPAEEQARAEAILREAMEGAATLNVPLVAEVHAGGKWSDCK